MGWTARPPEQGQGPVVLGSTLGPERALELALGPEVVLALAVVPERARAATGMGCRIRQMVLPWLPRRTQVLPL